MAERRFMERALELARRGEGRTSPNPMVGAVVVRDGRIVGSGFHRRAGEAHAEIEALREAGDASRGADVYVTLEPCCYRGRTGACTEALIEAGVARVVYAMRDPNPRVDGAGHERLAAAGIEVVGGLCEAEARELNRPFTKWVTRELPFVTAKFAMSLDGKIATRKGDSQWISGAESRLRAHRLRNVSDVVLVGAGTVLADDPRLTTRLEDVDEVRHPLRVVLDSRGRVPPTARVFSPDLPGESVLAATRRLPKSHRKRLAERGVAVWLLPEDSDGRVDLPPLLRRLAREEKLTVLVEGGSELLGSFFDRELVDRVVAVVAPVLIGGSAAYPPAAGRGVAELARAPRLRTTSVDRVGGDVWIVADRTGEPGADLEPY